MPWAVVTGASRGIGQATAMRLAHDGWDIVAHYHNNLEGVESTAAVVEGMQRQVHVVQADFGDRDSALACVDECWKLSGGVDAWVHLAGVDLLTGSNAKLPFEWKLELATRVDLHGTIFACREVGQRMFERGQGSIVTIGWDQSATGMDGDSGQMFAAVKAGVAGFSRSLAKSLAPKVRINCVAPGWIKTAWGEQASADWQSRVLSETPLRRWGEPDDVAAAIAFLVSRQAGFLTGQTFNVNGGVVCT